jgi:hypothetical protein
MRGHTLMQRLRWNKVLGVMAMAVLLMLGSATQVML